MHDVPFLILEGGALISCVPVTTNPTHFPIDSRLMAIAEPMTSCMSEPMMASSTMSHRMIRGTWGGRNISINNEREQHQQREGAARFSLSFPRGMCDYGACPLGTCCFFPALLLPHRMKVRKTRCRAALGAGLGQKCRLPVAIPRGGSRVTYITPITRLNRYGALRE